MKYEFANVQIYKKIYQLQQRDLKNSHIRKSAHQNSLPALRDFF